ncbi:hypothetical protein FA13DRAFT_1731951 [Coprinellus micaceus]|uniref:Uncharacterized protein n=1 Tax=Coprinellus micaceus TaxID=71717 RepID=A0A4Y7TF55_COPMI|nr:hypothetical protein FA13DRAFT_1731951 [Coprinellus micaceus]
MPSKPSLSSTEAYSQRLKHPQRGMSSDGNPGILMATHCFGGFSERRKAETS